MKRHDSKGSVTSVTSSSRGGEKKIPPTHMIIQREHDNKLMLLPITHAVNSSVTRLKVNNTATFRSDLNNRKQERGRIIQMGSKEVCIEQLQVFEMIADVDTNNAIDDDNHDVNKPEEHEQRKQNRKKQSTMPLDVQERVTKDSNRNSIAGSTNKTANISTQNKNIKSKRLQFDDDDVDQASDHEDDSPSVVSQDSLQPIMPTNESMDNSSTTRGKTALSVVSRNEHQGGLEKFSSSKTIVNPSSRNNNRVIQHDKVVLDSFNSESDEQIREMSNSEILYKYQTLSTKCNQLSIENIRLQLECDRLTQENQILRTTTVPMPDAASRQWIINMARQFSTNVSNLNISKYATDLGISPQDLISCIQDTTSNTARQVIKQLYPLDKLLSMTGPEVPDDLRATIRAFAESQRGPIQTHKFNEAINGVFRSAKSEFKFKHQENEPKNSDHKNKSNKQNNYANKGHKSSTQLINKNQLSQSNNVTADKENNLPQENESDIE